MLIGSINRALSRIHILAILVVAAFDFKKAEKPGEVQISDLSRLLLKLKLADVLDLKDFVVSAGGEESEDVSRFIRNHLLYGDVLTQSPLGFSQKGLERCRKQVWDALLSDNPKMQGEIMKVAEVLDIDLNQLEPTVTV